MQAIHRSRCGRFLVSITAILAVGPDTFAAPPPVEVVSQLVQDLDSNSRTVRQSAEKQLLAFGSDVLSLLPDVDSLENAAARETVRRIRLHLERQQAVESLQASTINLSGRFSREEGIRRLALRTGNMIDVSALSPGLGSDMLDVVFDGTPFWTALDRLLQGVTVDYEFGPSSLRLVPHSGADKHIVDRESIGYSKAFRIAIDKPSIRPIIGNANRKLLQLRLQVVAEPRLRPLFLNCRADEIEVKTAGGLSIQPYTPSATFDIPFGQQGQEAKITIGYIVPESADIRQLEVRGRVQIQMAAAFDSFLFADLRGRSDAVQQLGVTTVRLRRADIAPKGESTVSLAVNYGVGGPAFESHRNWVIRNEAFFLQKGGKEVAPVGNASVQFQGDGAYSLQYQFNDIGEFGELLHFVYRTPTLIIPVEVDWQIPEIIIDETTHEKESE